MPGKLAWKRTRSVDEPLRLPGFVARRGDVTLQVEQTGITLSRGGDVVRMPVPPGTIGDVETNEDATVAMIVALDHGHNLWRVDLSTGACAELAPIFGGNAHLARSTSGVVIAGSNTPYLNRFAWSGADEGYVSIEHPPAEFFGVDVLAISHDGSTIAFNDSGASEDVGLGTETISMSQTRIYDVASKTWLATLEERLNGMVVSADGALVLTNKGVFAKDDLETLRAPAPAFRGGAAVPGTTAVVLHDGTRIFVFDFARGEEIATLYEGASSTWRLDVDPINRSIAAYYAGDVRIWHCAWTEEHRPARFTIPIDGRELAFVSTDEARYTTELDGRACDVRATIRESDVSAGGTPEWEPRTECGPLSIDPLLACLEAGAHPVRVAGGGVVVKACREGAHFRQNTWFEVTIRIVEGQAIDLDVKIAVQDDSYY
ncbi:MAG: hypothetical protein JWP87_3809 [Labilithrix sp.]|nr:hypothetical protein [Labilithrix sp.]